MGVESKLAISFIRRRDGTIDQFNDKKIKNALSNAALDIHLRDSEKKTDEIYQEVKKKLETRFPKKIPTISDVEETIIETARMKGEISLADHYQSYRSERAEARSALAIMTDISNQNQTDAALLIESDSKETVTTWNREKIIHQLQEEAQLSYEFAKLVAKKVENIIVRMYRKDGIRRMNTTDIRGIVDLQLRQFGLEASRRKQALLSMPTADLEAILFNKSHENSNVASNNPEALNLEIAERNQKQYALENIFSPEVTEAHRKGAIHLHDLGYPARAYCSSHSIEYIKKYGLDKLLANLESKSNSPNSAAVLNQHVQTFLASLQAHYAGALGFGFLNILYAPLLNRPVSVIKGKLEGKEVSFEKNDLEKLVEEGTISLEKIDGKAYFEKISEKKEMRDLPYREYKQVAQNLIFAASQNAFSRGGQTLFIDFNIHTGVPHYLKNVPAIGPGGKYMIQMPDGEVKMISDVPRFANKENLQDSRNGDAYSEGLEGELKGGKILVYGDFAKPAQKFAKAMMDKWGEGDKDGRPFHFPKCDLHIDENTLTNKDESELFDFATQVASKNGSIYFMFDRGDGAVLAQCCRLKEKITDPAMLKHPERLRFCGFQNVTVNLAQAAYKGKNLEGTLKEIDNSMNLALQAHLQKAEFFQKLLDTDGSPQRSLGKLSDDGSPYIDLKKATYIIGNIGLNEAVQSLNGKQLHESEEAYRLGLEIVAHMYKRIQEFKKETGLKFTIEETPAESTTRRFAKIDLDEKNHVREEAKKVVKGTEENPYYTNSIHFAPDAEVGLIDRIVGQSRFHDMIESGAIVHAWVGERRPSKEFIRNTVENTLRKTRCSQLVFSPTYTECDSCGNVMTGEKELCTNNECDNHEQESMGKNDRKLHIVTRIVGYNSRLDNWNGSQKQIYEDRKKAEGQYAGGAGQDMSWIYNPNGHNKLTIMQFGKNGCDTCKNLEDNVEKKLEQLKLNGNVEYKKYYLDTLDREGLKLAAMYDVPLDSVPTLVIAGKNDYWKKTTKYAPQNPCKSECGTVSQRSDLIKPSEIGEEITKRAGDYQPAISAK